jgi:hypothetical protein
MKLNAIIEWLKQPSSIKALCTLAGAIGYAIDPTKLSDIIGAVLVLQALVNGIYDRQPPKPPTPPAG